MTNNLPKPKLLSDYKAPDYLISRTELTFELNETKTKVTAKLTISANPDVNVGDNQLVLDGENLVLNWLKINGRVMDASEYEVSDETLTLFSVPEHFTLESEVFINPKENTALEGLYLSRGNYCTQCEAEGFRKITYYLDRPDVLSVFTTTIIADTEKYPYLLSNGNQILSSTQDGVSTVKWEDPFPKPCYLFALVGGDFDLLEDHFITRTGRKVKLALYVEKGELEKSHYAMRSLIASMKWDEERFSLEYDLDIYMIVAVSDFNMGAMENKGLNVFNTKYVLANKETATDMDYLGVEGVIGHEYFHNWTGNRVTCKNWFQLSLKEGLTVFRDQEFSSDLNSRPVKRIEEVNILRSRQFAEDNGPMSHPVRPASYIEMNNFYTMTVYNKGAEVIRMLHTLLGEQGFQKGMKLYFERHDGDAVTTEDFVRAMYDANDTSFLHFERWYHQAGTPIVAVTEQYDADTATYQMSFEQHCEPTADGSEKQPWHIPIKMALFGKDGQQISYQYQGNTEDETVLSFTEKSQTFTFNEVKENPVPSLLRDFSAPVKLKFPYAFDELAFLFQHDTNAFNRWDAGQQLATSQIFQLVEQANNQEALNVSDAYLKAFEHTLMNNELEPALIAEAIRLPTLSFLTEEMYPVDIERLHEARKHLEHTIAQRLQASLLQRYQQHQSDAAYQPEAKQMGDRALKNKCLYYLSLLNDDNMLDLTYQQFSQADNMTDKMAAFHALVLRNTPLREKALSDFYQQYQNDALVLDKWFTAQALSDLPDIHERINQLVSHEKFSWANPNRMRSVVGAFCMSNLPHFHDKTGKGYQFLGESIKRLNGLNPQVAARMISAFNQWRRFDKSRQEMMVLQLKEILALDAVSKDVYEIASKSVGYKAKN